MNKKCFKCHLFENIFMCLRLFASHGSHIEVTGPLVGVSYHVSLRKQTQAITLGHQARSHCAISLGPHIMLMVTFNDCLAVTWSLTGECVGCL